MLTIPTAALLQAWERGHDASPGERGLILLRTAYPEVPAVADWPVGQRDAALLDLFERLYGARLAAQAEPWRQQREQGSNRLTRTGTNRA